MGDCPEVCPLNNEALANQVRGMIHQELPQVIEIAMKHYDSRLAGLLASLSVMSDQLHQIQVKAEGDRATFAGRWKVVIYVMSVVCLGMANAGFTYIANMF